MIPLVVITKGFNIGALIIRIGFWDPVYYTYNKEPPQKIVFVIIKSTIFGGKSLGPHAQRPRPSTKEAVNVRPDASSNLQCELQHVKPQAH